MKSIIFFLALIFLSIDTIYVFNDEKIDNTPTGLMIAETREFAPNEISADRVDWQDTGDKKPKKHPSPKR